MLPWFAGSKGGGDMQDELSIEKARVAILVEERNELLRKVFELEEQVRRLTKRALDAACACGSQEFYTDKVLGVVCCRCQAPRQ